MEKFQIYIFSGISCIAIGVALGSITEGPSAMRIIMIALGGFLFILGMKKKKESDEEDQI